MKNIFNLNFFNNLNVFRNHFIFILIPKEPREPKLTLIGPSRVKTILNNDKQVFKK